MITLIACQTLCTVFGERSRIFQNVELYFLAKCWWNFMKIPQIFCDVNASNAENPHFRFSLSFSFFHFFLFFPCAFYPFLRAWGEITETTKKGTRPPKTDKRMQHPTIWTERKSRQRRAGRGSLRAGEARRVQRPPPPGMFGSWPLISFFSPLKDFFGT